MKSPLKPLNFTGKYAHSVLTFPIFHTVLDVETPLEILFFIIWLRKLATTNRIIMELSKCWYPPLRIDKELAIKLRLHTDFLKYFFMRFFSKDMLSVAIEDKRSIL